MISRKSDISLREVHPPMNDWNLLMPLLNDDRLNLDYVAEVLSKKEVTLLSKLHYIWHWQRSGCKPSFKNYDVKVATDETDAGMKLIYVWLWHKAWRKPCRIVMCYDELSESFGLSDKQTGTLLTKLKSDTGLIDVTLHIGPGNRREIEIYVYRPLLKNATT